MDLFPDYLIEACVQTAEEAVKAEKNGAQRLELCARLDLDGLTPPQALIEEVLAKVSIPVKVMVRPRAGGFAITKAEAKQMEKTVQSVKQMGISGIVAGGVHPDGKIDIALMERLIALAGDLPITFHKAFDLLEDPLGSLEQLKQLGIKSVLTSGKAATAYDGRFMLREMLQVVGEDMTIIAAGKVTHENLTELHRLIGAREYHGRRIVGELSAW